MEHSIALVTGATSGLGLAAARTLAGEGWREIIVTGRSLARVGNGRPTRGGHQEKDFHAAGAGAGHPVQRDAKKTLSGVVHP